MITDPVSDDVQYLNITFSESVRTISNLLTFCSSSNSNFLYINIEPPSDMLNTEWAEIEIVELLNNQCDLGFSLMGSKSTGVVIRSIFPGSIAEKNGHLRIGDHLMYIDEVNVRGMTSEQVAAILRQCADHVRLIVARPISNYSDPEFCGSMSIIPTEQLDQHLDFLVHTLLPVSDLKAIELYHQMSLNEDEQEAANFIRDSNFLELVQNQLNPAMLQGSVSTQYSPEQPLRKVAGGSDFEKEQSPKKDRKISIEFERAHSLKEDTKLPFLHDPFLAKRGSLGNEIEDDNIRENELHPQRLATSASTISSPNSSKVRTKHKIKMNEENHFEEYTLELTKGEQGLGLTIAGYITCRPEVHIHGIFVKSITKNSAADLNGQIAINDQIIEINEQSVIGYDNPAVVEILKQTSGTVKLKFHRYTSGPIYEILSQTAKSTHTVGSASQSSSNSQILNKSNLSINNNSMKTTNDNLIPKPIQKSKLHAEESPVSIFPENTDSTLLPPSAQLTLSSSEDETNLSVAELKLKTYNNICSENATKTDELIANILPNSGFNVQRMNLRHASIDKTIEDTIKSTWNKIIGNNYNILISYITTADEGLGISLEGTVDVDDVTGLEDKPHHYLRNISCDGPIGRDSIFKPGDELLEVNGKKLYGVPYQEVLSALKALPSRVQIVAARKKEVDVSQLSRSSSTMIYDDYFDEDEDDEEDEDNDDISIDIDYHSYSHTEDFLKQQFEFGKGSFICYNDAVRKYNKPVKENHAYEEPYRFPLLTKAKSDYSIFVSTNSLSNLLPMKALTFNRSLQYLKDVAMWSGPILVELNKESQGLGFSIDYYQDASSNVPVIVISSLVPNGVAHRDGRIIPGDRLLFINEIEVDLLPSKNEVIDALRSLPKGEVLLGIAKPMFPSSNMYRSYSKETVDELSPSQSLEYEPFSVAEDIVINSTYNSLQRAISSDVRLYHISTCIVQQTLHNAAIHLRDNYDILVMMPCSSSELSERENVIESRSSTKENILDGDSTILQNTISSVSTTPRRKISVESNHSYREMVNNYKEQNAQNFGSLSPECDVEAFIKAKIISEHTSSNTASSDINSSSSIDCLDELEVTKVSESDTDAMIYYWKKSKKSDQNESKDINVEKLKRWCFVDLTENDLKIDTTKWCGIGYPVLKTENSQRVELDNFYASEDIITDIDGQSLSQIRPSNVYILLDNLRKPGKKIKIGYIPADDFISSSHWLPVSDETLMPASISQRVYKCSPENETKLTNNVKSEDKENHNDESQTNFNVMINVQNDEIVSDFVKVNGWSSPRTITIIRDNKQNLGISILGGKVANVADKDQPNTEPSLVSGIFITHITKDSPAEKCDQLHIGDRLLSVNGKDLLKASYDDAINHIKNASSPIVFTVQSLIDLSMITNDAEVDSERYASDDTHEQDPISVTQKAEISGQRLSTPPNSPEKSAVSVNLHPDVDDKENSFSVSSLSNESVTPDLFELGDGDISEIVIEKQEGKGLGLLLVGNKNCSSMNCFICGFKDNSVAALDGRLKIGDELLKINDIDVHGMSHSNVAPIIKKCQMESDKISLTIRRHPGNVAKMACIPSTSCNTTPVSNKINIIDEPTEESKTELNDLKLDIYGEVFNVHLDRSTQGFGFFIMDGNANDEPGIYVKKVTVDGTASQEGTLREGDRILSISNELVVNDDYDSVLRKLRSCKTSLDMIIGRNISIKEDDKKEKEEPAPVSVLIDKRESVDYGSLSIPPPLQSELIMSPVLTMVEEVKPIQIRKPSVPVEKEPIYSSIAPDRKRNSIQKSQNTAPVKKVSVCEEKPKEMVPTKPLAQKEHPTKAQIIPGVETVIELTKDRGLGLSIIGGSDTILGTVMIHEVHENEAAAIDGRLWAGDRILAVNGKDLRNATHDQAIQALRSVGNRVKLKIFRDKQPLCEDSIYFKLKVDLVKKSRKGLGICIVSKTDVGVCISDLVKGSVAEQDGRLKKGDLLLEINDVNIRSYTQEQVAALLKRCSGNISLMVGRLRSSIYSLDNSKQLKKKK